MTAAALRTAAVPRALRRAVAGSRTLRLLLLLGGVLTLGLLFCGPARAAEPPAGDLTAGVQAGARPGSGTDTVVVPRQTGAGDTVTAPIPSGLSAGTAGSSGTAGPSTSLGAPAVVERAEQRAAQELRRVAAGSLSAVGATGAGQAVETVRETARPVTDGVRRLAGPLLGLISGPLSGGQLPEPGGALPGGDGVVVPDDLPSRQYAPVGGAFTVVPAGTDRAAGDANPSVTGPTGPAGAPGRDCGDAHGGHAGASRATSAESPAHAPAAPVDPCRDQPGAVHHSGETHTPRAGDQPAATSAGGSPDAFACAPGCPAADPPTRDRPRDVLEFPG
ncbi:hypothetical protein GLX30_14720 [Streptomyces sp. Tu 2975]|uniref:hypothetical protein n=1 Tax=Streptomyces sp. Tu 2975 TaxID=2676871 RepID=UPI0013593DC7|nr:hypothetical protein [Streptomyces sp. Tu 2975]QIP85071.1 hypothetical protein GLX30_14720 [Streptomyces sp. Tu 2975]